MHLEYLGRKYNIDAAWKLIEEGHAELVTLSPAQVQAIKSLPPPTPLSYIDFDGDPDEPLVLARDAIPGATGPREIVAVLIDGWGRFLKKIALQPTSEIQAWVIEDVDLVEERIVEA